LNILITGGAGFIGSHLTDALLHKGHKLVCVDNLVIGSKKNIMHLDGNQNFAFIEGDISENGLAQRVISNYHIDFVYHLAANSDIQKGGREPDIDFLETFLSTRMLLEGMRLNGVKNLFFASTSAVYGEKCDVALSEDIGGLAPVSYYGGAKLASEAFISSYTAMNDMKAVIFRFPNIIGPRLTHGVIFDFIEKLRVNPQALEILGDGTQFKPYLHVFDLVRCIMLMTQEKVMNTGMNIFNIGVGSATTVVRIAEIVREKMGLPQAEFRFTGGDRGWKGDVPRFEYDTSKINAEGWSAALSSDDAVIKTVEEVLD